MTKKEITIWGRKFDLEIVFDCYEGEEVLSSQKDALDSFLSNTNVLDECKGRVIDYCLKNNNGELEDNKIDNIFKYVIPQKIYVSRTKDNSHLIGIMCAYKFDIEHGIAIIFKNEKFEKIDLQDELL